MKHLGEKPDVACQFEQSAFWKQLAEHIARHFPPKDFPGLCPLALAQYFLAEVVVCPALARRMRLRYLWAALALEVNPAARRALHDAFLEPIE